MLGRNYTEIILKDGRAAHKVDFLSRTFNFSAVRFLLPRPPLKPIETQVKEHSVTAV